MRVWAAPNSEVADQNQNCWREAASASSPPQAAGVEAVEAVFTITIYIAISKFGDTLGVELEPVFSGLEPILHVSH